MANYQYPTSLAKKISNQEIQDLDRDIEIKFNKDFAFYWGTDGMPQTDKFDFVTIALHEIAHGLGFSPSMNVEDESTIGEFGISGMPENTSLFPTIFDKFLYYNTSSDRLVNTPNQSATLKNKLTSNAVFFDGVNSKAVNSNQDVKLYAPATFVSGSSISHLDDIAFQSFGTNGLMTWSRDKAEAIHTPGAITLSILQDLGWEVNRMLSITEPITSKTSKTAWPKATAQQIKWIDSQSGSVNIELYVKSGNNWTLVTINNSTTINPAALLSSRGQNTYN